MAKLLHSDCLFISLSFIGKYHQQCTRGQLRGQGSHILSLSSCHSQAFTNVTASISLFAAASLEGPNPSSNCSAFRQDVMHLFCP